MMGLIVLVLFPYFSPSGWGVGWTIIYVPNDLQMVVARAHLKSCLFTAAGMQVHQSIFLQFILVL